MKKKIIENIFSAIDQILEAGGIMFSRQSLMSKLDKLSELDGPGRRYANQTIKRTQARKWIDMVEKNGRIFYRVTPLGAKKISEYKFRELKIAKKDWDGLWRVIVFDIPETERYGRDALRDKLKYLGVYSLQKSVFVCPFDCEQAIMTLAGFYNISDYVEVFLTRAIGRREKEIRKYFGI
jgi:phenylacetic acid degradation operon negative regulatory protein